MKHKSNSKNSMHYSTSDQVSTAVQPTTEPVSVGVHAVSTQDPNTSTTSVADASTSNVSAAPLKSEKTARVSRRRKAYTSIPRSWLWVTIAALVALCVTLAILLAIATTKTQQVAAPHPTPTTAQQAQADMLTACELVGKARQQAGELSPGAKLDQPLATLSDAQRIVKAANRYEKATPLFKLIEANIANGLRATTPNQLSLQLSTTEQLCLQMPH